MSGRVSEGVSDQSWDSASVQYGFGRLGVKSISTVSTSCADHHLAGTCLLVYCRCTAKACLLAPPFMCDVT
jgi:hypothetical protein